MPLTDATGPRVGLRAEHKNESRTFTSSSTQPLASLERLRDVVVVGAGLAGSTIAAALAQRGWDVLLVERDQFPRHKVCGEFLSPEAQHSLAHLGVLPAVAALDPIPLHTAAITTPGGVRLEMALPGAGWGLSRYALDEALAAEAVRCGAELWLASTVTGVTRTGSGAVQIRRNRQTASVQARSIIFACGRHSAPALPPRSGSEAKGGWRHCAGLKRHYRGVTMEPRVDLYLFPGGYVGINPIEGGAGEGRANVCVLITYAALQATGKSLDCVLAAASERHPSLARVLQGALAVAESECAVAPVDTERRPAPWDVTLAAPCLGDTAGMIPPLAGDGMAMALRSAELCLSPAHAYLSGNLSLEGWAQAYARAWRSEFGTRLRVGGALQRGLTMPWLGDRLAGIGRRLPALAELMLASTRGRAA